jgi:nucleoside-diphosphate-sugar epimerase
MKVLVTGATGFIGSRLARMAREAGHEVVATGQLNNDVERQRSEALARDGVQVTTGSLLDAAFVASLVQGCNTVIHLAAAQHEANVPDEHFRHVNVDATRTLIEAAIAAGASRFVYGSTIGIYGSASEGRLDEESPPRPENIYGTTKLEAERMVGTYARSIEVVVIRISETYGPGDFRLLKLFKAIHRGRFMLIGPCLNQRQVIHVDDLSRGLLLGATHPDAVGETFVLAGREVMTTRGMVRDVAAALGRPTPRLRLPLWPFSLAAVVLETTLRPLGIQPPLHRRRLDFFRKSFLFSTAKAEQRLGFVPAVTFTDGARQTARWYDDQGLI